MSKTMSEELDLTSAKWNMDSQIYLDSIKESIKDNYPQIELEQELVNKNLLESDLLDKDILNGLLEDFDQRFPENAD
jgi:hypothetical protein